MKTLKLVIGLLIISSTALVSCKKDFIPEVEAARKTSDISKVSSFKDLKVNAAFDWKNNKEIVINVQPLNTPMKINKTLLIKTEGGEVLFSKLQTINEVFIGKILVPSSLTKLVVSYGTISKTETITNNQINFNYMVEDKSAE